MTKIIAILLSNLMLLHSLHIDFKDISNVNVLLKHAKFHQEKYGDSFVAFLYEHYVDQEFSKTKKHNEHNNLPFKQGINHFNHLPSILDFDSSKFEILISNNVYSKKIFFHEESYSKIIKHSIFQPPRFA